MEEGYSEASSVVTEKLQYQKEEKKRSNLLETKIGGRNEEEVGEERKGTWGGGGLL